MFVIGAAEWSDKGLLYDIDLKCFDDVWSSEYWLYWLDDDTKAVFLVKDGIDGPPVGMAVCALNEDGIVIEKLCVKKPYRCQGVSRMLLDAIKSMTFQYGSKVSVYLAIPEPWMYEGYSGTPNGLTDWVSKVGFQATKGILPNYFCINGESLNGIRFAIGPGKRVPLCWSCNTRVRYVEDGWICTECGQHGKPDNIEDNWEDGRLHNTPYMGEE